MTLTNQRRRIYGTKILDNLKKNYGIETKPIERPADLKSNNVVATFRPRIKTIEIKMKSY